LSYGVFIKQLTQVAQAVRLRRKEQFEGRHCYSREEAALKAFASELKLKAITPEAFFRMADQDSSGAVTPGEFKAVLHELKIKLERSQVSRILMILDEDLSGEISKDEYFHALEAYGVQSEDRPEMGDQRHFPLEHQVLFKLLVELESKQISHYEMFNSCDTSQDGTIDLKELENFVEGLDMGIQKKETHALLGYLDVDRSHTVSKEEFLRQLKRGQNLLQNKREAAGHMEQAGFSGSFRPNGSSRKQVNNYFRDPGLSAQSWQ
jgi:Ca2+-binding EF-hand superfamily protein